MLRSIRSKTPFDQRKLQVSGTATPIIVKSVGKKKVLVVGAAYDLADGRIRLLN
jgi:hypothetical protein